MRPWKRLLTFARVSLGAGASTRVALNVSNTRGGFTYEELINVNGCDWYVTNENGAWYTSADR